MIPVEVLLGMGEDHCWTLWEIRRRGFWERHGFESWSGPDGAMRMSIEANLANGDEETAEKLLADWMRKNGKRSARVSRYVPGSHFYALNEKFGSLEEAQAHILECGMLVEPGVREVHVYGEGG